MVVVVVGKARHRRHQSQGKPETNGPNVSMDERPAFFFMSSCKAADFDGILWGERFDQPR